MSYERESLPGHFLQAEKHYRNRLLKDPSWKREHEGKYVLVVGETVVDRDESFDALSRRVRDKFGCGALFMPFVYPEGEEPKLRSPGRA